MQLKLKQDSSDVNGLNLSGNSPRHQLAVYSFVELPHDLSLYTGARYVDELPAQGVDSYVAVDFNVAWQPSASLKSALTLRNANDSRHIEFGGGNFLERNVRLSLTWTF
jgi:iron complex outermembrane receptor protein